MCMDRDGTGTVDMIIQGDTGVTLTSSIRSGAAGAGAHTVLPGGTTALVKIQSNEWAIYGDIS